MDSDEQLFAYFDKQIEGHASEKWAELKKSLPLGATVSGTVVAQRPYGVWVDIGVGFPALNLVVRLKDADVTPYTSMEMYPGIGTVVEGRVYVFIDESRRICLTQLTPESMLGETS